MYDLSYPVRVQRAPNEGVVYIHYGSEEHPPLHTRSFRLFQDDTFEAVDVYEAIEMSKRLRTWYKPHEGRTCKVGLPPQE